MLLSVYRDVTFFVLGAITLGIWADAVRHYVIALRTMNGWLRETGQFAPPSPQPRTFVEAVFPRGEMPGVPTSVRNPYQHHLRRFTVEMLVGGAFIVINLVIPA